ncbi:diacylglycerol kinase family protein [Flavobacterium ardleyense]|uniref:diacylglycerol kinase family protein n=1 Tax=Flavobacterium ardleyense TaxID=2038737 RepID=UPI00298CAB93|nr:diacylglycerol kinase family protein [Flavobacterium ardleyense]
MEFKKDTSFISGRIKSFSFAYKGAYKLITTEHSIMAQLAIGMLVVGAGFYFDISREEWIMQTMATGMVLAVEGLNTAVEKIADFIHPGFHKTIGFIKDIAAGAVFFAATAALIVGALIYWPYIF